MSFRIGFGFDTHRLVADRKLIIGGIQIHHFKGASGHSDADVLIHAICDALLGAANLGDIGLHFPDSDIKYKDANSEILLQEVYQLVSNEGFKIGNIDCTVCLETPKLKAFIHHMKENLSTILNISNDQISIKAKTSEKLGFIGREEGISAYAMVLLESKK